MRAKKCKVCRESFTTTKPMQVACSLDCALELARRKREKDTEKEVRARKESLKSLSDYTKEAQAATDEPNSEWHESCFAGFVMLAMERFRRNPSGFAH